MKRQKITLIFIIIYCISLFPSQAYAGSTKSSTEWPDGPSVNAASAIVMEASTGLILYEKNIYDQHYPASITKIMSALIAIENSSLGEVVTFSKNAVYDIERDSSQIGINVGEQLTMQQCLYAMLLESANEVTYAVAEHVGGGNLTTFVDMMNKKAAELGCKNTHFMNPHGLHNPEHYTCAYDMALITKEAMKNDTFSKITGTRTYKIPPTNIQPETRYLRNHHRFILKQDYLYDGVIGGKTGYTSKSKYTLVTVAKRGDLELICVILRDDSFEHQYTDTQKLLNYGFDNFSIYPVSDFEGTAVIPESPLFTRYNSILSKSDTSIHTDKKGYLVLPKTASFSDAKKEVSFYKTSENKDGRNVIGTISYTYNGKYVGGTDIIYENTSKPALTAKESGTKNEASPSKAPDQTGTAVKSGGNFRPVIIGIIAGIFILAIIIYFVITERSRMRRRRAYYKRRASRKRSFHDDDFLDL